MLKISQSLKRFSLIFLSILAILTFVSCGSDKQSSKTTGSSEQTRSSQVTKKGSYKVSDEEKAYLKEKFDNLSGTNPETIGYVYAPGTKLDEQIVQTTDNATYLDKTFEGGNEPYLGTVFMDYENDKTFNDQLNWLFGHARRSKVADHRMFNDVNYYDDQKFFDKHPYVVVETPDRKHYYEAAFLIIVPETTAFYKTLFDSKQGFKNQLKEVAKSAHTKNKKIKIDENDKYLVLSTCREDDETIRSNLYLREIPETELGSFLDKHASELAYKPTR
ncbi:class B sortase, LPKTxAVK-specific [Streptococcus pluranimalium]|uniref:class B sortase, LPKTxAVK-specific n=1 Tax=Streptococcus pluranimalium TaxID=82348 RepID=UPI003F66B469